MSGWMPLEILVDAKKKNKITTLGSMGKIDQLVQKLTDIKEFGKPLSYIEMLKFAKQAYYDGDSLNYAVPNVYDVSFIAPYLKMKGDSSDSEMGQLIKSFVDDDKKSDHITLVMMDVDKFKVFNDTHGHLMGDQILKFIGKLLKKECKEPVVPVRLGGEEFALLCPSLKDKQALTIAEGIRKKLASVPFTNKRTGEKIPPVTASFGVAQRLPEDSLSSMIERADQALYAAKDAGRNQVKLATI